MRITIDILRRSSPDAKPFWQSFYYELSSESEPGATVATVLSHLNEREPLVDVEGRETPQVRWECSCLQKKCGACAMVINGRPSLACSVKLSESGSCIRLEPLRKFPVIVDLVVDRSIMRRNLEILHTWLDSYAENDSFISDYAYKASKCLQCGCCLEVCPNFYAGGIFTGMAGAVPLSRILMEMPESQRKEAAALYRDRVYAGCGKSLACHDICPAKIEIDRLLVNSNAVAVWKRYIKK